VDGVIRLPVPFQAQFSQPHAVGNGVLVDAGEDEAAVDLDFLRLTDVDGEQFHRGASMAGRARNGNDLALSD
jgi:hypothetical protein